MSDNFTEDQPNRPSHIAYSVQPGKDDKNHWHRIGAAWPTKGEGLTLKLTAIPLDGVVALRSREELERMRAEREAAGEQPVQAHKQQPKP
ncbi:MAG: hypothetical protein AB7E72_01635 [Lysobacterales bacterium]